MKPNRICEGCQGVQFKVHTFNAWIGFGLTKYVVIGNWYFEQIQKCCFSIRTLVENGLLTTIGDTDIRYLAEVSSRSTYIQNPKRISSTIKAIRL